MPVSTQSGDAVLDAAPDLGGARVAEMEARKVEGGSVSLQEKKRQYSEGYDAGYEKGFAAGVDKEVNKRQCLAALWAPQE